MMGGHTMSVRVESYQYDVCVRSMQRIARAQALMMALAEVRSAWDKFSIGWGRPWTSLEEQGVALMRWFNARGRLDRLAGFDDAQDEAIR